MRRDGPSPEALRAALQTFADLLNEDDPDHHYSVHDPERPTPPGAVVVTITSSPPDSASPDRRRVATSQAGTA